jgi:nucleotide-binding universal stress UspA family protein
MMTHDPVFTLSFALPIILTSLGIFVVVLAITLSYLKRKHIFTLYHQERMAALEKGVDLPPLPDALVARERERTRLLLDRLLAEAGLPKRALLLRMGAPADAIEAVVDQENVGVLVLGSMTRGRIGRLVLGSTAEKLLHTVACDLLVVKPTGFRSTVAPATRDGRGLVRGARRMAGSAGSGHD